MAENLKINSDYDRTVDKSGYMTSYPVGSVVMYFSSTVPDGWILCDGQTYNISDYPELGAAIGSIYGGNGTTTFAVPPLVYHATSNPNVRYPSPSQSSGTIASNTGLHTHTVTPASPSSVDTQSWTHTHATTAAATSNVTANHNHDGWSATISSVANSNQSTNRTASSGSAEYHNDVPHTHSAANSNLYLSVNYPNTGANVTNNVNEGNNPTAATNAHSHTVNFHTNATYSYSHNHSASYSGGAATTNTQSAIAYPLSKEAYFIIKC